jgi:hypothetical protein
MHIATDLDGTLLNHADFEHLLTGNRDDLDVFHELTLSMPVYGEVLDRVIGGSKLTVITHREELWRGITTDWLALHSVPYDELVMRPNDDTRKAWEVKIPWLLDNNADVVFEDNALTLSAARAAGIRVVECPLQP